MNDSLLSGSVPWQFKEAVVIPLLKKRGLYANSQQKIFLKYRPVSNLPFLSKVLEKVVLHQLHSHLLANKLSETFQSAYHTHHSTETALLDITSCFLGSGKEGRVSKAFEWYSSYLSDRFLVCQHQWSGLFTKEAS